MGDRTALQAIVHDCPLDQRVHVAEILKEYLGEQCGDGEPITNDSVDLGEQYMQPEASCGSADELADKLAEIPDIVFTVWEDPKYEWLGSLNLHTPGLGLYRAECTADGAAVKEYTEIRPVIVEAIVAGENVAAAVAKAFGRPWVEAIAEWTKPAEAAPSEVQPAELGKSVNARLDEIAKAMH